MSDPTPPNNDPTPAPTPAPAGDKGQEQEQHVPYERFKKVNDDLKALKQQLAALNGEKEQQSTAAKSLEERLAAIERERDAQRAENLRLKVASRKQLPEDLADRLRGNDEAELEADADRLLAFFKPKGGPGVPPPGGGSAKPMSFDLDGKSPAEIRKAIAEGKVKLA